MESPVEGRRPGETMAVALEARASQQEPEELVIVKLEEDSWTPVSQPKKDRDPAPGPRGFPPALQAVPVQGGGRAPRGLLSQLWALCCHWLRPEIRQRADPGAAGAGAVPDHLAPGGPGLGPGPPSRERRGGGGPRGGLGTERPRPWGSGQESKSLLSKGAGLGGSGATQGWIMAKPQ